MKLKIWIFLFSILAGSSVWALKLKVSATKGSYELESEARRWRLSGRGRELSFKERACAKDVWDSFRQKIDSELTGGFARLPNSLEKFPADIKTVHFEYNGKSFRIPADSQLGKYLDELPEEVIFTRRQEKIFCSMRAAKK